MQYYVMICTILFALAGVHWSKDGLANSAVKTTLLTLSVVGFLLSLDKLP